MSEVVSMLASLGCPIQYRTEKNYHVEVLEFSYQILVQQMLVQTVEE